MKETTNIESWQLSDDAKTLKIKTAVKNAGQDYSFELVYTKSDYVPDKKDSIVNGRAKQLIKPAMSPEAQKAKVEGDIIVEVLINENGDVVLAKTIGGHKTMAANSEQAARLCKFTPTKYKGVAISVTGIIVYTIARA